MFFFFSLIKKQFYNLPFNIIITNYTNIIISFVHSVFYYKLLCITKISLFIDSAIAQGNNNNTKTNINVLQRNINMIKPKLSRELLT